MNSKQEQLRYFEQVACLERQKIHSVHEALASVADPYVARILLRAASGGAEHYQAILRVFDVEPLKTGDSDMRLNVRRSALGTVRIDPKDRGQRVELAGYSVNLSTRGMCLETRQPLQVGEHLDIQVMLYDAQEASVVSGKVVWSKEVLPGFFMVGIAFGS